MSSQNCAVFDIYADIAIAGGNVETIMGIKEFDEKCRFRYDEFRKGGTKKGEGEHTLLERCILMRQSLAGDGSGCKACLFPEATHLTCRLSSAKKHAGTGIRFKGKWRRKP